jgi:hypothetical protein
MEWWKDIWTREASTWACLEFGLGSALPDNSVVAPNSGYLSILLKALQLKNVRKGLVRFSGAVHSFISIPHLSGNTASFHVFTSPATLQNIDSKNADRILVMDQRLLGPIPYRGGDLNMQIGLFSIRESDVTEAYIKVLESMSKAAGVSYISAALPFVAPLRDGVNLLAGTDSESILEIGLARIFNPVKTGYYAVVREEKQRATELGLSIASDGSLYSAGIPYKGAPYLVIGVEVHRERPDWFQIPELAKTYNDLLEAVRSAGNNERVRDAGVVFKRTALTSPDLLTVDAQRLVRQIEADMVEIAGPTLRRAPKTRKMRQLADIELFIERKPKKE